MKMICQRVGIEEEKSNKLQWLCQSPSGIDTETKRMGGYAAAARYSIVLNYEKDTIYGK